ncbi:MAG: tripartite tricarboxylate transporter substrate binding protein [Noviherbaspirillum sp.]|nr:tripartite tricarboxylate transporter substrate binding protein [Noviherbaspirillum sp.]MDB5794246.1 tripartite tricarboxylate transporter substrate binding protein [Noviherbaspirillum sp.]
MHRRSLLKLAAAALALLGAGNALAQAYPTRPIQLIVPFPPGGGIDIIARTLAQKLSEEWGQQVVVENKAGASGIIGTQSVARAAPDGYTILMASTTTHGINPAMYPKLQYDAIKDFAPISLLATVPHVLVVNPNLPIGNLAEFIRYAKSHPGMTFGSAGIGSVQHLAGEMLKTQAQLDFLHVPFKGSAPATVAVMSGEVDFISADITSVLSQIKSGRVKPVAVAASKRVPGVDIPTFAESGMGGFEVTGWFALFAPAGTPKAVVDKIGGAAIKALGTKEMKEKLAGLAALPIGSSPDELTAHVRSEISRWTGAVKSSGAKPE